MATNAIAKVDTEKFKSGLDKFKADVEALAVSDVETCLRAKTLQRDIRLEMKLRHCVLDPFVESAKQHLAEAREQVGQWIDPLESLDGALAFKVKNYERIEREKAAREEEERNRVKRETEARAAEEQRKQQEADAKAKRQADQKEIEAARKAGDLNKREAEKMKKEAEERERQQREQAKRDEEAAKANFVPDRVAPAIPTVAGVPSRRNYKFRIIDASRVPRQYLCPDEVKIGRDVRDWKKVGEVIPGVEAYEE